MRNNNKKGNALLLAMLVMAGIITVSSATNKLIINEVQQSIQLDKAIVSFYAAESGVERGLFEVRKKDFSTADINDNTEDLANNSSYQIVARDYENILYTSLEIDETYQLDLYKPSSLDGFDVGDEIKSLAIDWTGNVDETPWLEIKWHAWKTDGSLVDGNGNFYTDGSYISVDSAPYTLQLFDDNTYLYSVRITARNAVANNIEITAYDNLVPDEGERSPIPGRVAIKSLGEYPASSSKASRQAILATMPYRSPLSSLFDYVIFTEEEVKKEN